uniref:Type IV secretion system DNA-binding domain-containing protein n=2 Tax=Acidithiobacillus ferrianus TaxID=2678518 RepID=A0A845UPM3_9PROT|nr:type IV secretion system DNA-binding domain-containing protein [Acidithiobacillus ferrianus]
MSGKYLVRVTPVHQHKGASVMDTNATPGRKKESFLKGAGSALYWLWTLVMVTSGLTAMGMSVAAYHHGMIMMPAYVMAVAFFGFGVYGGKNTPRKGSTKATRWQFLGALWVTATAMAITLVASQSIGFLLAIGTLIAVHRILLHKKKVVNNVDDEDMDGEFIRGARIFDYRDPKRLAKTKTGNKYPITIGGVEIPRDEESSHFLFAGGPGMGKSVAISQMLETIRLRGERAIVYDPTGEYLQWFYRPGDKILNPLDARSEPWTPWSDADNRADFEALAGGLIADDERQPFFPQSARALLVAILETTKSVSEMTRMIMASENEELIELVKKCGLLGLVGSSQTFSNSRASMTAPTTCLRYLRDTKPGEMPFSIRKWVMNEEQNKGSWLFLTSRADQRTTLRPLLSLWLDIAINGVMMMSPNRERRLWLMVDELPTLQKMLKIAVAMAECRKYGLCVVTGIQTVAQLKDVYGIHGAEVMLGLPQTQTIFRLPDPDTAAWASKAIGSRNLTREVLSESSNSSGGGESSSFQNTTEDAILPSQIQSLPKLEAILSYSDGVDGVKKCRVKLAWKDRPSQAQAYVMAHTITPEPFISETAPGLPEVVDESAPTDPF